MRVVDLMGLLRILQLERLLRLDGTQLERLLRLDGTFEVLHFIFELGQAVGICKVECYGKGQSIRNSHQQK